MSLSVQMTQTPSNNVKLWAHHINDRIWTLHSYIFLFEIDTYNSYWKMINTMNTHFADIFKKYSLFLMKNDILPQWEDKANIKGGCWSFKISKTCDIHSLWNLLGSFLITDSLLCEGNEFINGISITFKHSHYIIKLWMSINMKYKLNNSVSEHLKEGIFQYHNKNIKKDFKKRKFYHVTRKRQY